ncbi:MAG TPA: response regulator [Sphingobium sp.]
MAKRIFVVEDNALNLRLFCDLLAAHGHETCAVRDGREAFAKARDYLPDLIITDIQLPYVSGFDLIRQFRQESTLADVPIMAVTAYAGPGDEERIRAAGANIYVSKPISVVKFIAVVNDLFALAAAGADKDDGTTDPGAVASA